IEDAPEEMVYGPYYYGAQNAVDLYSPGEPDTTKQLFEYCEQMIPDGVANPQYGKFSETALSDGARIERDINDVMGSSIQGRSTLSESPAAGKKWRADGGDKIAEEYAAQERTAEPAPARERRLPGWAPAAWCSRAHSGS